MFSAHLCCNYCAVLLPTWLGLGSCLIIMIARGIDERRCALSVDSLLTQMEPKCMFFTYSPRKRRCWLKDSEQGEEEQDDRISGSVKGSGIIPDVPSPPKIKTYDGM